MDPTIAAAIASGLAALLASVITNRVAGRASRRDNLLRWAEQLRASEEAARQRADRIRDEADADVEELRTKLDGVMEQLREAQGLASRLTDTLTSVAAEVWRPEPDIAALRRLVGRPSAPGVNGRHL